MIEKSKATYEKSLAKLINGIYATEFKREESNIFTIHMGTITMKNINLGDEVKDSVTGFIGVAVARTLWINGCTRWTVQPKGTNKDGKTFDSESFDQQQLVLVKASKVKEGSHKTGGPRENVKLGMKISK